MNNTFEYNDVSYTYSGCKAEDVKFFRVFEFGGWQEISIDAVPQQVFDAVFKELGY